MSDSCSFTGASLYWQCSAYEYVLCWLDYSPNGVKGVGEWRFHFVRRHGLGGYHLGVTRHQGDRRNMRLTCNRNRSGRLLDIRR